mmetsp:Transcript_37351/g.87886  ORF Transcript_37351/g.87886 Transcript_37351/m.87886 type:complete len:258 (+) Transcript_37351:427-1200(+)
MTTLSLSAQAFARGRSQISSQSHSQKSAQQKLAIRTGTSGWRQLLVLPRLESTFRTSRLTSSRRLRSSTRPDPQSTSGTSRQTFSMPLGTIPRTKAPLSTSGSPRRSRAWSRPRSRSSTARLACACSIPPTCSRRHSARWTRAATRCARASRSWRRRRPSSRSRRRGARRTTPTASRAMTGRGRWRSQTRSRRTSPGTRCRRIKRWPSRTPTSSASAARPARGTAGTPRDTSACSRARRFRPKRRRRCGPWRTSTRT